MYQNLANAKPCISTKYIISNWLTCWSKKDWNKTTKKTPRETTTGEKFCIQLFFFLIFCFFFFGAETVHECIDSLGEHTVITHSQFQMENQFHKTLSQFVAMKAQYENCHRIRLRMRQAVLIHWFFAHIWTLYITCFWLKNYINLRPTNQYTTEHHHKLKWTRSMAFDIILLLQPESASSCQLGCV